MRFLKYFLFFLVTPAFASDYWWETAYSTNGIAYSSYKSPTPSQTCDLLVSAMGWTEKSLTSSSSTFYTCKYRTAPNATGQTNIERKGTDCPSGSNLDETTGICVSSNPCSLKTGTPVTWIVKYTQEQYQKAIGGGGSTPNQWIDSGGCKAEISTKSCGTAADGSGACFGVAVFNGDQWPADSVGEHTDCTGSPDCPAPKVEFDASNDHSCTAITYTGNGASQYQCVTEAIAENPGAVSCGQVTTGGSTQWVCTAPKPTPTSEKSKVTETVKTTPNADGSTDKETTKVTETTKCKAGVCQTETTTNVTNSGTNTDGSEKPSTETCKGPECADDKTKEELEEEDEVEASASGVGCAETLACDGDAVACAILRSQKEEKCTAEEAGDYPGKKSDIDALLTGPQFEAPQGSEINLSGIFSTGTRFLPSACPAPMPLSIASVGRTITISFAPLCTLAEVLSYLIVAMAGLFFVRYVGEGQ